jgi:hypothetical protein
VPAGGEIRQSGSFALPVSVAVAKCAHSGALTRLAAPPVNQRPAGAFFISSA